jgi:peptide/nickel transport system substrate-binding protein
MTRPYWSRYADVRVSRRRALRSGAMLAVAAAALPLVGCSDGASAPTAGDRPRPGATLRFGTSLPMSYGLDPHLEQSGGLPLIAKLYGYTHHVDPRDGGLILDHAASIEQTEPDVYVFRLGEHRFHAAGGLASSGRSVTAHDVVSSWRRFRDHPLVVSDWWHTNMLVAEGAANPRTVIIRTKRPYADSLHEMGQINAGAILPRESIDGQLDLRGGGVGSGPLHIDTAATPERARLLRFDAYAPRSTYVDAMEWRVFASDAGKASAFREGAVDVAGCRDLREAEELGGIAGAVIVEEPSLSWTSIGLRVDRPPFDDLRVRRAIDIALDRDAMIEIAATGRGEVAGPVNPHLSAGFWSLPTAEILAAQGGDRSLAERRTEARSLLDAAGAASATIKLQVAEVAELLDLAAILREQLGAVGLTVSIEPMPLIKWFFSYQRGTFDATLISHPPYESPDSSLRLYHSAGGDGTGNRFGFNDLAIDALIERSWGEMDRAVRQDAVLRAQRQMIEARPMVHLFTGTAYTAARLYVRNSGLELPGSLSRYHYAQWLDLPVKGRPD